MKTINIIKTALLNAYYELNAQYVLFQRKHGLIDEPDYDVNDAGQLY